MVLLKKKSSSMLCSCLIRWRNRGIKQILVQMIENYCLILLHLTKIIFFINRIDVCFYLGVFVNKNPCTRRTLHIKYIQFMNLWSLDKDCIVTLPNQNKTYTLYYRYISFMHSWKDSQIISCEKYMQWDIWNPNTIRRTHDFYLAEK